MIEIEKFDLHSMDIKDSQLAKLKELFPEIFTEGSKIDWERLKLTLGEEVDTGKERYGMNWPGKADCFRTIQQPSIATLVPCPEESLKPDGTPYQVGEGFCSLPSGELEGSSDNLFIEGDNLEVLKLLQKSYLGRIKMIYIDPPYNTGNDFIYPDNYTENLQTYLEYTGQVDSEGRKFGTNTDTDGRFHSKWMNMMYPRLFLAKNLLKEDGYISISIDDHEVDNLKKLCLEIFGEENFIGQIVWEKMYTTKNDSSQISDSHEYILLFGKNATDSKLKLLPRTKEMDERYSNPDNDSRGVWKPIPLYAKGERKNGRYEIKSPTGKSFWPESNKHWLYREDDTLSLIKDNRIYFGKDGDSQPNIKRFLTEVQQGTKSKTLWKFSEVGSNDSAKKDLKYLFPEGEYFDFPKPITLIDRLIQLCTNADSIILDFFAGSCTSAHSVLSFNKNFGGSRNFICVQLPQPVDENSEAAKAGYKNIADIGKERIRRVIANIKKGREEQSKKGQEELFTDNEQQTTPPDLGFKVYKLAPSNFKLWDSNVAKTPEAIQTALELHVDHISEQASQEALLYEILLKSGFELTTDIEKIEIEGKTVFSIAEGELLICLEKAITNELIKAIAERKPIRVVCLDEGFHNNDQLKSNAVQIMKSKGVVKFQTV